MASSSKKQPENLKIRRTVPRPLPKDAMMNDAEFVRSINFNQLRNCLEEAAFRLLASASIISVAQPILKKYSHNAYPLIMIVGASSTGKSPSAKAMLPGAPVVPINSTNRNFRKSIEACELGYAICDDIFPTKSQTIRNRFAANIQDAARFSYDGSWPVLVLTAESGAEEYLSESARSRTLLFHVTHGIRDNGYSKKLAFFQNNTDWLRLISRFGAACKSSMQIFSENYQEEVADFRQRYSNTNIDPKAVNIVFSICYAWKGFNRYIKSIGGPPLMSDQMLTDTEQLLFSYSACADQKSEPIIPLEERILERVLQGGYFTPQHPYPRELCENYIKGISHLCDTSDLPHQPCRNCYQMHLVDRLFYDPTELVYQYGGTTNSLLIDDQTAVYQYCQLKDPVSVLIVEPDLLLYAMNRELEKWHKEQGETHLYFTSQKLHSTLFSINRCMALPNGKSGYRYRFEYPCEVDGRYTPRSVLALLLKPSEAEELAKYSPQPERSNSFYTHIHFINDIPNIVRVLKSKFAQTQYFCGTIGVQHRQK